MQDTQNLSDKAEGGKKLGRILTFVIIGIMVLTIGMLAYTLSVPAVSERFTEFYILGATGKASDYPKELILGGEGRLTVGIINHEGKPVSYRVEITINGTVNNRIGPISLADAEVWEGPATFKPSADGVNRVDFVLYEEGSSTPKDQLQLWVKVSPIN